MSQASSLLFTAENGSLEFQLDPHFQRQMEESGAAFGFTNPNTNVTTSNESTTGPDSDISLFPIQHQSESNSYHLSDVKISTVSVLDFKPQDLYPFKKSADSIEENHDENNIKSSLTELEVQKIKSETIDMDYNDESECEDQVQDEVKTGAPAIHQFDEFASWDDLFAAVKRHCDATFQPMVKRGSKRVDMANAHIKMRSHKYPEDMMYTACRYRCSHHGSFISKGKGLRQTKSMKGNCQAKIYACLDRRKKKVVIKDLDETHNHELGPDLYKQYVKNRALDHSEKMYIKELLNQQKPIKEICREMRAATGKDVTNKDIHNIKSQVLSDQTVVPDTPDSQRVRTRASSGQLKRKNYHSIVSQNSNGRSLHAQKKMSSQVSPLSREGKKPLKQKSPGVLQAMLLLLDELDKESLETLQEAVETKLEDIL